MTAAPPETRGPGDPAAWEPIVGAIGPKVRDLRQQIGLSLQQLAQRSGVSAAAIHKVERSDMVPTITTLLKLAAALERPIGHFVEGVDTVPVAAHVPAGARPAVRSEAEGVELRGISGPPERFRAAGSVATIAAGAGGRPRPRPGEELLLVLEGALDVEVAGERYTLRDGDALHYPTDRPHSWSNSGADPSRAIWLSVPEA
ncbi:XRE family transcriptional regulator [Pseudonocardia petroleophila]|uniref:Cupin domain-containing protein n=1 Tax=Pseudonocardia petroleophila TaxID=37331 RepID=A0A7G7MDN1_9PSEU|nr:cupin domain-containing protein [Pseudonocardia petroleophila]QNG50892.1 cupin domain-containing protein [Pseudonocardia petroleophila]